MEPDPDEQAALDALIATLDNLDLEPDPDEQAALDALIATLDNLDLGNAHSGPNWAAWAVRKTLNGLALASFRTV